MRLWSAIVALSFIIGGIGNNLIPWLGLEAVICVGGALVGIGGLLFYQSVKRSFQPPGVESLIF